MGAVVNLADVAKKRTQSLLLRTIASAFEEGATIEQVGAYLSSQGIGDPDRYTSDVASKKRPRTLGDQELKDLGGRDAFRAALGLDPVSASPVAPMPREPLIPMSLAEAHAVVKRWFGTSYDVTAFDAMLATLAVLRLAGDAVWLLLITGPGGAKTETLTSAEGAGAIITSTISSEGALLSGTSKSERAKDATGGLLRVIGETGVLVIKDVTSILSMHSEVRASVLAALREIYDGRWQRNVGASGGQTLSWRGRLVLLGAVTTEWDQAHACISSMGDRFVIVRLDSQEHEGRMQAGRQALQNLGSEVLMREELADAAGRVIAGMTTTPEALTTEEEERLLRAAQLVTLCRTAVITDPKGDVIDAHAPEMPTRFGKQLMQIARGARAIGISNEESIALALRCARDSMPPLRLEVLDALRQLGQATVSDLRGLIDKPYRTVVRAVEALHLLGAVTCVEEESENQGPEDTTKKRVWWYALASAIDPTVILVAEMSAYVGMRVIGEKTTHRSNETVSASPDVSAQRRGVNGKCISPDVSAQAALPLEKVPF